MIEEKPKTDERRKWLKEIKSASKAEEIWRNKCKTILEKYRGDNEKKNSFNILFSNTDTLSPAVYNSKPKPDVRRRFNDEDALGKAIAKVLGRALEFSIDTDCFENTVELNVYDYLLLGRSVARIRYVPSIIEQPEESAQDYDAMESESYEEIEWEQVVLEHVQHDDFRRGPGRSWEEVQWIAFKHRLSKEEIAERFGKDKVASIAFDPDEEDAAISKDDKGKLQDGTTEVWEVWDKDNKQVLFLSEAYQKGLLKKADDPLKLKGFWCIPKPLYAFIDSTNLIPVPLYALYEQQALELDRISARIIRLIAALKVRGIYDATIAELSQLFTGEENQLFPAQNISIIMDRGGLDKAIWFMDISPIVEALKVLYEQREQTKQVIYEIMGLSDILRGSSNANETATAQGIKAQWGGMRVNRIQRAIQFYIRDIIRLMAEVIGQKFQLQTLQQMTGLQYPTNEQVQQQMMQWQQQAQMAQMQGQQPPPQPEIPITWEQIQEALKSDISREFKVDVETDSTIAASQQTDMMAMKALLDGLAGVATQFAPLVQAGVMPVEAVKELLMAVIRRAKMGSAVEDAFDKIQQPPPQPQAPEEQDNSMEIAAGNARVDAAKHAAELQAKKDQAQIDAQLKQQESNQKDTHAQMQAQVQLQSKQMELDTQLKMKEMELSAQIAIEKYRALQKSDAQF